MKRETSNNVLKTLPGKENLSFMLGRKEALQEWRLNGGEKGLRVYQMGIDGGWGEGFW